MQILRFSILCLSSLLVFLPALPVHAQKTNNYFITSFGAIGDGKTINTIAINQAIQMCHDSGGGTVVVPAGVFVSGTIRLLSNINLQLEPGAVISGSKDTSDYLPLINPLFHEGYSRYGLLIAHDAVNISITGFGEVNGNGASFMHALNRPNTFFWLDRSVIRQGDSFMKEGSISEDGPLSYDYRPGMLFTFDHCENIHLADIQIKDPPEWTMRIGDCNHVFIRGIHINNNPLIPNNDGINCTSSSNVNISNCQIFTGDDAIAISSYQNKSGTRDSIGNQTGMAENFIISNCILSSRSSCIRIGDGERPIKNIEVSHIIMHASNRGIGIFARDNSDIQNLFFSDIVMETHLFTGNWWGKGEPIHISAVKATKEGKAGKIRHVRFSHVTADAETGIVVYGSPEASMDDLEFDHIALAIHPGKHAADYGGNFDLQPMFPSNAAIFKHDIPGLFAQYVSKLTITNFEISWDRGLQPYFTNGIEINHFKNINIEHVTAGAAFPFRNLAGIHLENGIGVRATNNIGPDQSAITVFKKNIQ